MAVKVIEVAEIGPVSIYKRSGVKGVKLSLTHDGNVRVSLPTWAPYRLGVEFALAKADWIMAQRKPRYLIKDGDRVGKAHRFVFEHKLHHTPTSRIRGTDIAVHFSQHTAFNSHDVQKTAEKAAIRALKKESEQLLPQRLKTLAEQHKFSYNSVSIKRLKSRWGSCNDRKDIVLNCFLMQLPWHLIDYVLLHELTHTKVLQHGEPFWSELSKHVKNLPAIRKEIKQYQTTLIVVPGKTEGQASTARPIGVNI